LQEYIDEVVDCLNNVDIDSLKHALDLILETAENKSLIYVIGNGGSASLASHFVTDLLKSGSFRGLSISAISLVDNSSLLTATSNDMDFEDVYAWQLKQIAKAGDLLIAISSSGNSRNIVKTVTLARDLGLRTLTLSGFDGGAISNIADVSIVAKSKIGNYGPVEDAHSVICHYLSREIGKR